MRLYMTVTFTTRKSKEQRTINTEAREYKTTTYILQYTAWRVDTAVESRLTVSRTSEHRLETLREPTLSVHHFSILGALMRIGLDIHNIIYVSPA